MSKRILIGVGTFFLLVIGTALLLPRFIDWNAYKNIITEQVRAQTGRTMDIRGDLSVRLLPSPALTMQDVRVRNIEGAHDADMVRLSSLEVNVALLPLFHGEVQVRNVRLVDPVISLESLADGRNNWTLAPAPASPRGGQAPTVAQAPAVAPSGGGAALVDRTPAVRLDNFVIANATIIYRRGAQVRRIDGFNARITMGSLKGPFDSAGDFTYQGKALHYEVSLGKTVADRTLPLNLTVTLPGDGRIQASGAIVGLNEQPRFKGKVKFDGQDAYAVSHALAPSATLPSMLAQPFSLEGEITASAQGVEAPTIALALGTTKAKVGLSLNTGKTTTFKIDIRADQIALDTWLALKPGTPASSGTQTGSDTRTGDSAITGGGGAPIVLAIPNQKTPPSPKASALNGVSGALTLSIDTIAYRDAIVSNTAVQAHLEQGKITLSRLSALLPGAGEISLSGVAAVAGPVRFDGNVSALVNDPRTLASWLGVTLPEGVRRQAHRINLRGQIQATPREITVSGVDMALDRTHIRGGITLALRKRLAFGASVTIDRLDLDGILGDAAVGTGGGVARAKASTPSTGTPGASKPENGALQGLKAWSAMGVLKTFDANARAQVKELIYRGETVRNIFFDGSLVDGALTIRKAGIENVAGASAQISGTLSGFGGILDTKNVSLSVNAADSARFAHLLGVGAGVPPTLGKVAIVGRIDGSVLAPSLDLNVSAAGARLNVNGKASALPVGALFDGEAHFVADDTPNVLRRLSGGFTPSGPLGKTDMRTRVIVSKNVLAFSKIQGQVGGVDLSGQIQVAMEGARPIINGALSSGAIAVPRFLPPSVVKKASLSLFEVLARLDRENARMPIVKAAAGDSGGVAVAAIDPRWSKKPMDLSVLGRFDANLQLTSTALEFEKYRLDNLSAEVSLKDGLVQGKKISGVFFGGPLNATVRLNGAAIPTVSATFSIKDADVNRIVRAVAAKDLANGKLTFDATINSRGGSSADLVSALAGKGAIKLNRLDVKRGGSGSALSGVMGLLATMNQLGGGAADRIADASATFVIAKGVARTDDFALTSGIGDGHAKGTVDLPQWRIDIAGAMAVKPNIVTALLSKRGTGVQTVPFSIKGVLDAPDVTVDTSSLTGKTVLPPALDKVLKKKGLGKILQQLEPAPAPGNAPAQPQQAPANTPIKPKDLLRGILEGVIK
ncbi:AsmA family protein [Varunaivibrio sulfuroxidans]|uniref:AsmA family protein n=1 Tax=Varunaivibrio sulfuroxidans TaxID=1773489 RepID=UPI00140519C4|nr:AsmA family protein [Varunaivibrio sulfuroxidans]WES31627.1 AsmA family protein [Varunaivibrio sulfuroxidans]